MSSRRVNLLLIEDSEDDAFFFVRALRRARTEAEFVRVDDGGAGIEYLRRVVAGEVARPDLVFLDLKLPGVTGFEVLEWLKSQNLATPLEVAVLSGSDQPRDVLHALELGAAAYHVKPLSAEQLAACLAEAEARLRRAPQSSLPAVPFSSS